MDIVGQDDFMGGAEQQLCGGFLLLKPTEVVKDIWEETTHIHQSSINSVGRHIDNTVSTEQEILNSLIHSKTYRDLQWTTLPRDQFPNGLKSLNPGTNPAVAHVNFIVGLSEKITALKTARFWRLSNWNSCE
jgi:hypothetical protein